IPVSSECPRKKWFWQMYGYFPGWLKVKEKLLLAEALESSGLLQSRGPLSGRWVVSCGFETVLVHLIVSPGLRVTLVGSKKKLVPFSRILTSTLAPFKFGAAEQPASASQSPQIPVFTSFIEFLSWANAR